MIMEIKKYILFVLIALSTWQVSAQQYYEVVTKQLNVMNAPTLDGQVLGQLKEHALVQVLNTSKGWATIKYEDARGFVVLAGLQAVDDEEASTNVTNNVITTRTNTIQNSSVANGIEVEIIPTVTPHIRGFYFYRAWYTITFETTKDIRVDERTYIPAGTPVGFELLGRGNWTKKGNVVEGKHYGAMKARKHLTEDLRELLIKPTFIIHSNGREIPVNGVEVRGAEVMTVSKSKKRLFDRILPFSAYIVSEGR